MRSAIAAAAASCVIGAVGFGGAFAMAGGEQAAWPCTTGNTEPKCATTSTSTSTSTTPGSTVTVTTPGSPPTTVTVPSSTPPVTVTVPQTVTVTTPGNTVTVRVQMPHCVHGNWDVYQPRCKTKLIAACKTKYRREIKRWCQRYEASLTKAKRKVKGRESQPPVVHAGGGVTG